MNPEASKQARWFLSCDWGTSFFRLRLVDANSLATIAESEGADGIASTFNSWKAAGGHAELRCAHFVAVVRRHIQMLEAKLNFSLKGIPLLIAGMASSSIGLQVLPYKTMPFATDGSDLRAEIVHVGNDFPHETIVISGVCTGDDVMRGEETQLVGAVESGADQLLIFPGTHSKHVRVTGPFAVSLRTYMTGEFFELLSKRSILAGSVEPGTELELPENLRHFQAGVAEGMKDNILHAAFRVRTRSLLDSVPASANFHYLSGLLIGSELQEISRETIPVAIVGQSRLAACYLQAFKILGSTRRVDLIDAERALIKGQLKIANALGLFRNTQTTKSSG